MKQGLVYVSKILGKKTVVGTICSSVLISGYPLLSHAQAQIQVVASYSVACDLVEQIAGDSVDLICLIDYEQDPHTYEATPADRRAVEQADVVFFAGLNFEPSIIDMVAATNTPAPKIALHEEAIPEPIMIGGGEEEPEPDPHVWHDVANGLQMVELISNTLQEADPDNADLYLSNAETLSRELEELDQWIRDQIETIPSDQRKLVTTHDSMSYYSQAYGLTVEGTLLGISTEETPSAATVKNLVAAVQEARVPLLFAELTANDKVLATVAREAGVTISENVLLADGLGEKGTEIGTYQGMLIYNTCTITDGLGGQCNLE